MGPDPKTIAIIGGQGRMGRWFARFFEELGKEIISVDMDTETTPEEAAAKAKVVMLAVPLSVAGEVVKRVGPLMERDGLIFDISSLKTEVMECMLKNSACEVVGTHPLWGPGEPGMVGQTVIVCPGRGNKWLHWLLKLFKDAGAHVTLTTPREHDLMMTVVQGLNHILNLALGLTIIGLGMRPEDLRLFSTPSFGTRLRQIEHLLTQDPELYADLFMLNPAFPETFKTFEEAANELKRLFKGKDKERFATLFQAASRYFLGGALK